jgi:hypothetical protein
MYWGNYPFIEGFILLALWSAVWTGLALWNTAKHNHKGWFIFFLVVHTAGIFEILYLVFVAKAFTSATQNSPNRRRKK